MPSNKIGIEIAVEFPSVHELQAQLAKKWASVKNSFDAKINVDVDGNSLRSMKKKIKTSLSEDVFKLKLDVSNSLSEIARVENAVRDLDNKLKHTREMKIDFKVADLDKSFRDILNASEKTQKSIKGQTDELKSTGNALDNNIGKAQKLQTIYKKMADGSLRATSVQRTFNDGQGRTRVVTNNSDGSESLKVTEDKKKALKEIESVLKNVHSLELKNMDADKESSEIINKQLTREKELLTLLKDQFYQKHKIYSMSDNNLNEIQRAHEATKALKEQSQYASALREEQNEINRAVSKTAQLEQKKQQLARQMVGAVGAEKDALGQQFAYYQRIQNSLEQKHNLTEKMTAQQKEELSNIKTIGSLEIQRTNAIRQQRDEEARLTAEERERQRIQQSANQELLSDLKQVHALRQKIIDLETRKSTMPQSDFEKLGMLKEEHRIALEIYSETKSRLSAEGLLTDELQRQVQAQKAVANAENDRVRRISEVRSGQEEANEKLKKYLSFTKQIGQLQRDMVFAGMRERNVINDEIKKLKVRREGLGIQNQLTDAVRREVAQIENAQREQARLNQLRSKARERDQSFNDTGGLIDPYSFMSNVEQGARAIIEPMTRIDNALVGVSKVADATEESLKSFAQSSFDTASSLGVSSDEYVLAVEKWVTAGKNFVESQKLAKISLVGSFVGNIGADDMVKYMAVPLKGFENAMLDANDVINVMNETANNNAIEMDDLGKAYMRSATTASDAGVTFEELTGMITGAQEATRKGGEKIGTGIKSIALNINTINAAMTKGEADKKAWFEGIGVKFANDKGEALSMTEVLQQLADKWDKLNSNDKGIAKKFLAGKEHSETLGAIINQWETVKKVAEEANDEIGKGENGSAYLEHAKQADSVKFKLAELKNAWDELMVTIGNSDGLVSKVLGTLTQGISTVQRLLSNDSFMTAIKYIFAGVAIHAGANLYKRFFDTFSLGLKGATKEAKGLYGALTQVVTGRDRVLTSGRNGSRNNGDDGTNGGGSTIVAGGFGRGRVRNQRSQQNEQRANSNNMRQVEQEAEQITQRVNGRINGVGRTVSKLAGAIPLVGDALLVLDILGVPVFDKIGEGVSKVIKTNKDLRKELDTTAKKFQATNQILNGGVQNKSEELEGKKNKKTGKLEGGIRQQFDTSKGKKGYLSPEEFDALQARFNKLAEEANIKVRIDVNDTEKINQALDALNQKLSGIKKEGLNDLGEQFTKQADIIHEAQEKLSEDKGDLSYAKEQLKINQEIIDKYREKMEAGKVLTESETAQYSTANTAVEKYKGQISKLKSEIEINKGIVADSSKSMDTYTDGLIKYIAANGSLAEMSKKNATTALGPMITRVNDLANSYNKSHGAVLQLNDAQHMTSSQWSTLQSQYPALKRISLDQVQSGQASIKVIKDTINQTRTKEGADIKAGQSAVTALAKQAGKQKEVTVATDGTIKATGSAKKEVDKFKKSVDGIKPKKKVDIITNIIDKTGGFFKKLWGKVTNSTSTHTIKVNKEEKKSVSTVSSDNAVSSASVSSADVSSPTMVNSFAKSATNASSSTDASKRVNSDVWRYWNRETYGIDDTESQMKLLTNAMNRANDNQAELIKLYTKEQSLLRKQSTNYSALYNAKDVEMNETLNSLRKLGFKVDSKSNKVNNLEYAKKLTGTKAESAQTLLDKWSSLYGEMSGIKENIDSLKTQIQETTEKIKDAKIAKELEKYEASLKRVDALQTSINNKTEILSSVLDHIGTNDKEKMLVETEKALNASKTNMSQLAAQYNHLVQSRLLYGENGKEIQDTLEGLRDSILKEADAVIKYQESLNDLEFSRVTEDLDAFTNALEENDSRIQNTIDNMQEGLLSGTSVGELQSSQAFDLSIDRNNKYKQMASERVFLEKDLQASLDAFAKKEVDRQKGVANSTLQIHASKYNTMLEMQKNYTKGQKTTVKQIETSYANLEGIMSTDAEYANGFAKKMNNAFKEIFQEQDMLYSNYEERMATQTNAGMKENYTNQYIMDNLKLQEKYYRASVDVYKGAIDEIQKQLRDTNLTDDQENKMREKIQSYQNYIINAQNNIKDAIKSRFEFEFSLLDKAITSYDEYADKLNYALDVIDSIDSANYSAKSALLENLINAEKSKNMNISGSISSLEYELRLYERGSYEWNIINTQLATYKKQLQESNKELLDMNKNIMSNSFDGVINNLEKDMFGGKTLKAYKSAQELWLDGLEKEMSLEDAEQRINDLGATMYSEKLKLLDKQEKISKYEMDYLNKQLDVIELQQKLENMRGEKTTQTLKQKSDGTWDFEYTADATQLSETEKELNDAKLALQKQEQQGREDYLSKLEEILGNAEDGEYKNVQELRTALYDLSNAYSSIVGDIPQIQFGYLNDILNSFQNYTNRNSGFTSGIEYLGSSSSYSVSSLGKNIAEQVSQNIPSALISKLPAINSYTQSSNSDKNIVIQLDKIEFPNITSPDGIKEAILNLPSIALQKSKEK